ncbi:CGNR zinc finger domain-containing protein [Streptomyces axinellae]|uniref:CGNR zinc finger domain-containing protein n=1 Tax=Streptomyces axinellae TaxID=552788 RepID=A0ABN3PXF9_9ACTN
MKFAYVSGNPALDLAGTVEFRRSGDPVDVLATPEDLERWVTRCDELPDRVTVEPTAFDSALALREALYGLALARVHARPFAPRDLKTVNTTAAHPTLTVTLSDAGVRTSGDLPAVLSHLARSGIALLADPHARLKECGGATCTRLYLDRSRGARRTWCGMEECGNRVKSATYRERRRTSRPTRERPAHRG